MLDDHRPGRGVSHLTGCRGRSNNHGPRDPRDAEGIWQKRVNRRILVTVSSSLRTLICYVVIFRLLLLEEDDGMMVYFEDYEQLWQCQKCRRLQLVSRSAQNIPYCSGYFFRCHHRSEMKKVDADIMESD